MDISLIYDRSILQRSDTVLFQTVTTTLYQLNKKLYFY